MLKCEIPEECRLDLWAKVIKAKYLHKAAEVLERTICIPCSEVGGYVNLVDDFKIKINVAQETLNFNKVKITIDFDLCLILIIGDRRECQYQVFAIPGNVYEETIDLCNFDPPLTPDEFRSEIDQSELLLCNWDFDYDILGNCEDEDSPCRPHHHHHHHFDDDCEKEDRRPVVRGTCLDIKVMVDIIDKLGKMHDVVVYGEINPDSDC